MKKTAVITLLLALAPISIAATDIKMAIESLKPMVAAIAAASKVDFKNAAYLPGYGLNYDASECGDIKERWPAIYQQLKGLNAALGQTVKGLDANDWLSFSTRFICDFTNGDQQIVARIKGADMGKPDRWEVWVNGELQK